MSAFSMLPFSSSFTFGCHKCFVLLAQKLNCLKYLFFSSSKFVSTHCHMYKKTDQITRSELIRISNTDNNITKHLPLFPSLLQASINMILRNIYHCFHPYSRLPLPPDLVWQLHKNSSGLSVLFLIILPYSFSEL